jgi:phage/plasmid primase-like uncharacterized protein
VQQFPRLILRIIVADDDLRLEFVQSREVSDAIEQSLNHPGTVPGWNDDADFYRHDVNLIEPE